MIRYKVLIVCEDGKWRNLFKDGRTFKQKKTAKEKMETMFDLGKRTNNNYKMKIEEIEVLDEKDQEITRLKKALEIANEAIGFYADPNEYQKGSGLPHGFAIIFNCMEKDYERVKDYPFDPSLPCKENLSFYGGKRAREAQKQIKEVLEG